MLRRFGHRYLDAREFGECLKSLKLRGITFPEKWLAFLEKERLLFPICRVE